LPTSCCKVEHETDPKTIRPLASGLRFLIPGFQRSFWTLGFSVLFRRWGTVLEVLRHASSAQLYDPIGQANIGLLGRQDPAALCANPYLADRQNSTRQTDRILPRAAPIPCRLCLCCRQVMGGHIGQELDLWSLGLMVYFLLLGRFPFWCAHAHPRLGRQTWQLFWGFAVALGPGFRRRGRFQTALRQRVYEHD
jgi:serine/threonine protein kinase